VVLYVLLVVIYSDVFTCSSGINELIALNSQGLYTTPHHNVEP